MKAEISHKVLQKKVFFSANWLVLSCFQLSIYALYQFPSLAVVLITNFIIGILFLQLFLSFNFNEPLIKKSSSP